MGAQLLPCCSGIYAGETEDVAKVFALRESVDIPQGTYDNVLVTEDWTPLDPSIVEHKSYADGSASCAKSWSGAATRCSFLVDVRDVS